LAVTLQNRSHFKFLGEFLRFMKQRIRRAKTLQELLSLLESGVRDLDFDSVEVVDDGETLTRWVNPHPVYPDRARIYCEDPVEGSRLTVKWVWPAHNDETYNEYIMLTWHRFLVACKAEMAHRAWDLSPRQRNKVVNLVRNNPE